MTVYITTVELLNQWSFQLCFFPYTTLSCQVSAPRRWAQTIHGCEWRKISRLLDHITNRYRNPAHSNYNLNYKNLFYIPLVFHYLSGYDAYFIIKEIVTAYDGNVNLLPITKEKYISITKYVDSIKDKNENNFQKNCIKLRFRFFQMFKYRSR